MTGLKKKARTVGFFYLLLAIVGPIRLIYVRGKLFIHGDAEATAANILAHETLFRLGIGADLFLGELAFVAWLLIFGAKQYHNPPERAVPSHGSSALSI